MFYLHYWKRIITLLARITKKCLSGHAVESGKSHYPSRETMQKATILVNLVQLAAACRRCSKVFMKIECLFFIIDAIICWIFVDL